MVSGETERMYWEEPFPVTVLLNKKIAMLPMEERWAGGQLSPEPSIREQSHFGWPPALWPGGCF